MKTVQALKEMNPQGVGKSINAAPVISRRSYNGKKVVMSSAAEISRIRTYFAALKNSRTTTTENPQDLVNSLSLSPIGDSYVTDLNRYYDVNIYTFGGLVLNVKGYDGEVFVNLGGKDNLIERGINLVHDNFDVQMNFFEVHADSSGEPVCSKLDLSQTMNFKEAYTNINYNESKIVSMAATDIDDDGYTDDFAVLVNSNLDVRLYFYKVVYENGTFKLKRHGNSEYKLYTAPEPYGVTPSTEASSALVAGDFDGDGKFEIAALYKTLNREKDSDSKYDSNGRLLGDVCVQIFKWDFSK